MQYTEAKPGRIFILRLEQGDVLPFDVEKFAIEHNIKCAGVQLLGGVDAGSRIISGPVNGDVIIPGMPLNINMIENVHESLGIGTIFPNEQGYPILHLHIGCGREKNTTTGCARQGVKVWMYMEMIIYELMDCKASRYIDEESGFTLLKVER